MFLFYNKSNKIIKGFSVKSFIDDDSSGFNPLLHKQYEGDFEIPNTIGTLREEVIESIDSQTVFELQTFTYDTGKHNISVFREDSGDYYIVDESEYVETDEETITFNNGQTEGVNIKFSSYIILEYEFDEETKLFSLVE